MTEKETQEVSAKELREEIKKWIDKLEPEIVQDFYDMIFMREGTLGKNSLKAVFEFGEGTKKAIKEMINAWADSAYAVENVIRAINMGPTLTWNVLRKVEPSIDQVAFIKARIMNVSFRDLLFDSEGATGFSLGAPVTHLIGGLRKLGIDIDYDISTEAIIPKRGLTFFKTEEIWSNLEQSANKNFHDQIEFCKNLGGQVASLEQILDYMLDVTIKTVVSNPLQEKSDLVRYVINFFVRPSAGGKVHIRTSSQVGNKEDREICTLVFDALIGRVGLMQTFPEEKAPNMGVIVAKKSDETGLFALLDKD
jgi:gas vesicle protein